MNAPPTFESFILFDGEKKITQQQDLKVPNAMIFTINKVKLLFLPISLPSPLQQEDPFLPFIIFAQEDHTLGNLLRHQLLKDPNVLFAGYKNPHPLDHNIILRVQVCSSSVFNRPVFLFDLIRLRNQNTNNSLTIVLSRQPLITIPSMPLTMPSPTCCPSSLCSRKSLKRVFERRKKALISGKVTTSLTRTPACQLKFPVCVACNDLNGQTPSYLYEKV